MKGPWVHSGGEDSAFTKSPSLPVQNDLLDAEGKPSIDEKNRRKRWLLVRHEVIFLLQLGEEKVQQLIDTRQIIPIRIAGEERFDSQDINRLIESYKTTASRRPQ